MLSNYPKQMTVTLDKCILGTTYPPEERELRDEKIKEAKAKNEASSEYFWRVRGPPWALWLKRSKKTTDM